MTTHMSYLVPLVPAIRLDGSSVSGSPPWVRLVRETGPIAFTTAVPPRLQVRGPRAVFEAYRGMAALETESFVVLCLNVQHEVVAQVEISRGILNGTLVHPREVFRAAIAIGACTIVLMHNHPSGDPTPSPDDKAITKGLVEAGRLLDIPVQDHIIIGDGKYLSFAEAGLL